MDPEREMRSQTRRPSTQLSNGPRKRPSKPLKPQQQQAAKSDEAVDDSAWIHRDKLAQIEIQEMEQAGMHVRQPHRSDSVSQMRSSSRATSRTGMRRTSSKDQIAGSAVEEQVNGSAEPERKRVSTIHDAEDYDDIEMHPGFDPELRTPEEVAAEQTPYRQHTVRPSTSRIPISKISPASVLNQDSPNSRSGSNAFPTSWDDLQYAQRMRSNSAASGVLLDDSDVIPSTKAESTPKAQTPTKVKPNAKAAAVNRKPLNEVTNSKATTPNTRPSTSSGHAARPSTGQNRPEGEAPWIATMYKPDPRLPPEEQMLPTHAKRMMQEQWEKEGKIGNAYDRELRLLNDEEIKAPDTHSQQSDEQVALHTAETVMSTENKENASPQTTLQQHDAWPIKTSIDTNTRVESPRPDTSAAYPATEPVRASTSSLPSPLQAPSKPAHEQRSSIQAVPRMPEYDEKQESKTRKVCCCVVM